jgi:Na+/melibiose symporter-like transporter
MTVSSVEQAARPGQGRVPLGTRILYGVGSMAEGIKNTAFNVFLLFYYNNVLGVSGTLTGMAIFLALCVDAVADPLIGSLSDGWRSRLGRRHPFMYAAAPPMALCFFLLFDPPGGLSEMGLFAWLLGFAIGVRVSMTLYMLPSNAMIPELTSDYDERTELVSWRFLFGWLGGIVISLLAYLVFFSSAAGERDGLLDASGYAGFGLTCAVIVGVSILTSALGTHRVIPQLAQPDAVEPFTPRRFFREARTVLANPSYRALVMAAIFAAVAGGFADVVGLYVNKYYWELATDQLAFLVYALIPAVLLAVVITPALTRRFDKKRAVFAIGAFAILIAPVLIFLRLLGWLPPNGDPILLPLIVTHAVISVACVVSVGILVGAMLADVVDEGELASGRRQEGMFNATISFAAKATSGLGGLVAGIALDAIAFPRGADPGSVPAEKVHALGLAVGPGLMILFLITLIFVSRYRITRESHRRVLADLERRREKARESGGPL